MIDLHCHVLPGVDDGPEYINESIEMCRIAALDGIKTIVATPHFNPGLYEPDYENVSEILHTLRKEIISAGLSLEILIGADVSLFPELPDYLKARKHLTINENGRYVLVEFPHLSAVPNYKKPLSSIMAQGIAPIITHPERNPFFMNHPERIYEIVSMGGIIQITAMSITGGFGIEVQEFSIFLLRHNMAHIIATDAHSSKFRQPLLSKAADMACEIVGEKEAWEMVTGRPAAVIEGKTLSLPEPVPLTGKKRWLQKISG